jgi:hypothetical protein
VRIGVWGASVPSEMWVVAEAVFPFGLLLSLSVPVCLSFSLFAATASC